VEAAVGHRAAAAARLRGPGPEHSSARLERYLQSCAEHNIQVAQPTTPAQMFHLLRSQVLCPLRKPLVVMTPKSLLRLPAAASSLDELASGRYRRVIEDELADPETVTRVLLCTGKIYYELVDERARRADPSVANRAARDAVSVVAAPRRRRDARPLRQAHRAVLGPGRAEQHGRGAIRDATGADHARRARESATR